MPRRLLCFMCDHCSKVFEAERQCLIHERTEHAEQSSNNHYLMSPLDALGKIIEDGWRLIDQNELSEVKQVLNHLQEKCSSLISSNASSPAANSQPSLNSQCNQSAPINRKRQSLSSLFGAKVAKFENDENNQNNNVTPQENPNQPLSNLGTAPNFNGLSMVVDPMALTGLASAPPVKGQKKEKTDIPSKKSPIWDYFTPENVEWCKCNNCSKQLKISTVANLQKHLMSRHPEEAETCNARIQENKLARYTNSVQLTSPNQQEQTSNFADFHKGDFTFEPEGFEDDNENVKIA